jgi:hypothetical protein
LVGAVRLMLVFAFAAGFEQEVKKCFADPLTYPPAYHKPTCWRGLRKGELRKPP